MRPDSPGRCPFRSNSDRPLDLDDLTVVLSWEDFHVQTFFGDDSFAGFSS